VHGGVGGDQGGGSIVAAEVDDGARDCRDRRAEPIGHLVGREHRAAHPARRAYAECRRPECGQFGRVRRCEQRQAVQQRGAAMTDYMTGTGERGRCRTKRPVDRVRAWQHTENPVSRQRPRAVADEAAQA
jgi:hypothetical protein